MSVCVCGVCVFQGYVGKWRGLTRSYNRCFSLNVEETNLVLRVEEECVMSQRGNIDIFLLFISVLQAADINDSLSVRFPRSCHVHTREK